MLHVLVWNLLVSHFTKLYQDYFCCNIKPNQKWHKE